MGSTTTTGVESGAERIASAFAAAREQGRAALMPYMMGGYPDLDSSLAIAEAYVDGGADLIELGVPFSDPLADGPVIHAAATRALESGTTLDDVLSICESIGGRVPVAVMCYANMVLSAGADGFAERLSAAGAAGTIVPDMPIEESTELREALEQRGLALIPLVAPTTPAERRSAICRAAGGFVYVVSVTGVTGERGSLDPALAQVVESVREEAPVPAAVGFGVGSPEQAAEVGRMADGVIIGSRLVRAVSEAPDLAAGLDGIRSFLAEARDAMSA